MVLYGIIMAGGSGTRFWPYSRENKPKQLLKIFSNKSLIEETVERLEPIIPSENMFIATNNHLANCMKTEFKANGNSSSNNDLQKINYVIEPMAKNTAACIGLSAISIMEKDPEGTMFIETADHFYKNEQAYIDTIRKAVITARQNKIVLIGIKPTEPHTGYGYIQTGNSFDDNIPNAFVIDAFKEKPSISTAKEYLVSGNYLWNSGLFIAKCSVMLEEIKRLMPNLYEGLMEIKNSGFQDEVISSVFENLENLSIDYGIMEKSNNTVVIKSDMHWDDIGDFLALERWFHKDDKGNIILSENGFKGNIKDSIVLSQTRKVFAENMSDMIIVDTPDVTFICAKNDMQNIKKIIERIKDVDLGEYLKDYVENYEKHIVSYHGGDCDVESDGMIAILNVSNLDIHRDKDNLSVVGIENLF